ncbi:MAG: hypothetical protein IJ129_04000 [Ruminococcus sp.]|nr:hypothetical protein [Ruminococcus sp.]
MVFDELEIRSKEDLEAAVDQLGFVPYFANEIEGFSLEEHILPKYWFGVIDGAWEWKGSIIRDTGCAYGKFFRNKAVYVSREWFCDFANFRRDGYDFDARYEDGLARHTDKVLYELVQGNEPVISKQLKRLGDYRKGGNKGFESAMTRLQHMCYVNISDFVYMTDRQGRQYGWGVAQYSTPEGFFGSDFTERVYQRTPQESYERIFTHLRTILPDADEKLIHKLLK